MTVTTEISKSGPYAGAGTTGPFLVNFRFLDNSHLRVIKTVAGVNSDLVLGTDYAVSGAGGATGTVTLASALFAGQSLTILRNVPYTQTADYVDNDSFPAESHEAALDLLTMQTQQNKEIIDRSIVVSPTSPTGVSLELPNPMPNNLLGWNPAGNAISNIDPGTFGGLVTYGSTRAETFDGNGSNTDFVLAFDALVSANCDVSVGGVVQYPDKNFTYLPGSRTVRFLTGAPAAGVNNVLVRYGTVLNIGEASAVQGQTAIGTALITAMNQLSARASIGAVGLTGAETIADAKTFSSSPILPTPTSGDNSNKGATTEYVDREAVHKTGVETIAGQKTFSVQPRVATPQSMVRINTGNGFGSTNTAIRRFTNVVTNQGSDITYADSATLGGSFTINTAGVYSITYTDSFSGAGNTGISLNSTQLTTSVPSISAADQLAVATNTGANVGGCASWTGYLAAGAVIRAHCNVGSASGAQSALFTIVKDS